MSQHKFPTIGARALAVLVVVGALATVLGPHIIAHAQPAQQANLLANGGFEPFVTPDGKYDYPVVVTQEGGGHVAEGWSPWWYWHPDSNDIMQSYIVPEFDIAPIYRDPVRVHGGNAAQQIFRPSTLWKAGVYQRAAVPSNATLTFSIYGHVWAGFCKPTKDGGPECGDNHDSFYGEGANPTTMKIGIDPTGGTDWTSPNIVWSQDYAIYDHFQQLAVSAQAKGSTVTVFTYTTFQWPAVINNVYWDDAALTTGGSAPAPAPSQPPSLPPAPGGEQTLQAKTGVNVRTGPGTSYNVIGVIFPGTSYVITGKSDLWYQINYKGQTGYVYGPLVLVTTGSVPSGSGIEAKTGLNVRYGPGTSYSVFGVIFPGTVYPIVDQTSGWYAITYKGQKGWVSAAFVTVH